MGLSTSSDAYIQPIYTHLFNQGLVEFNEFTLCLGKDGGRFIIGGSDETLKIHPDLPIEWINLKPGSQFFIAISDIYIGDKRMNNKPSTAMIDSGTTFTYMSRNQYNEIDNIVQELCRNGTVECLGSREKENCYRFKPSSNFTLKDFFQSFPVFKFTSGEQTIKWFPSEYFYEDRTEVYCVAIDPYSTDSRMVIGGSMMRQSMYVFDITNRKVGVTRARCSDDPNMYVYDDEQYLHGK